MSIISRNTFSVLNILCVINTVNTDQSAALKTAETIEIAMPRLLPRCLYKLPLEPLTLHLS